MISLIFLRSFFINQNANNMYTIPRQKAAITSVAKCTFNMILLRPMVTELKNNETMVTYFQTSLADDVHIKYARILEKMKEENVWPLGKL